MRRVLKKLSHFHATEVKDILKHGKRVLKTPECDFILAPQKKDGGRILVITPRKIGKAAQRNKVRRRLKALFYEGSFFNRGYDCVVIVKPSGIDASFDLLTKHLTHAFLNVPAS